MTLKDFTIVSSKQENSWSCGIYSIYNAIKTQCNIKKIDCKTLSVDTISRLWLEITKIPNEVINDKKRQGLMRPLQKSLRKFENINLGGIVISGVHDIISSFENIKRLVQDYHSPIIVIQFNSRGHHKGQMTYTTNAKSMRANRFHTLTVVDIEEDWILLNDSAYGTYSYIHKDDISIIEDLCYFNCREYKPELIHPIKEAFVTQGFFDRPEYYKQFGLPYHSAVDYRTKTKEYPTGVGTPVLASHNGRIKKQYFNKLLGNVVELEGTRYATKYCHLSEFIFKVDENVKQGEVIAKAGDTGNIQGNHLHFECYEYGKVINPLDIIK